MTIKDIMAKRTKGVFTIDPNAAITTPDGRSRHVTVGLLGTKRAIALCGRSFAPDHDEAVANALVIAALLNVMGDVAIEAALEVAASVEVQS